MTLFALLAGGRYYVCFKSIFAHTMAPQLARSLINWTFAQLQKAIKVRCHFCHFWPFLELNPDPVFTGQVDTKHGLLSELSRAVLSNQVFVSGIQMSHILLLIYVSIIFQCPSAVLITNILICSLNILLHSGEASCHRWPSDQSPFKDLVF